MLKLDFSNFFPSITMDDIVRHLSVHLPLAFDPSAARLIAYCSVWARNRQRPLRLCIGAPSSPLLSNSVMHQFDELLASQACLDSITYTRYADDITLSSNEPGTLGAYPKRVIELLDSLVYPRLKLNSEKTMFLSKAAKRVITGVILTPDDKVSIGRARKREIRAMYHKSITSGLDAEQSQRLNGLIAFAEDIEPGYSSRLRHREA